MPVRREECGSHRAAATSFGLAAASSRPGVRRRSVPRGADANHRPLHSGAASMARRHQPRPVTPPALIGIPERGTPSRWQETTDTGLHASLTGCILQSRSDTRRTRHGRLTGRCRGAPQPTNEIPCSIQPGLAFRNTRGWWTGLRALRARRMRRRAGPPEGLGRASVVASDHRRAPGSGTKENPHAVGCR